MLLDRGAQVHVTNNYVWTPVNVAANKGHLEVVKFLVDKGADIAVANNNGWTPVNSAARNGQFLVDMGADIAVANRNDWILIDGAVSHTRLKYIESLANIGLLWLVKLFVNSWTPINCAASNGGQVARGQGR